VDFLRKRLPSQVGRYLQGVQFPARKEELLGRLERNGVPGPVISQLRKRLPEGEYRSPQDVLSTPRRALASPPASAAVVSSSPRTNFLELRLCEVRRIPLLRTSVNKGVAASASTYPSSGSEKREVGGAT
jgi:Protein of unknown function (DUF2795)